MPKSSLEDVLCGSHTSLYAIIDAAKIEELTTQLLIYEPVHHNLFEGQEAMELEEVAPYLVRLHEEDIFTQWVFNDVYGNDGAIFIHSDYDIESLASHFRGYLHVSREVEHPETKKMVIQEGILALYDPRVLPEWIESETLKVQQEFLKVYDGLYYEDMLDKSILHSYVLSNESIIAQQYTLASKSHP